MYNNVQGKNYHNETANFFFYKTEQHYEYIFKRFLENNIS